MAKYDSTFSESWYRIADLKISLRPTVKISKQLFRGEVWYLIQDPFNNQFFRIRPEAYFFVSRLSRSRTVEEVWAECTELHPDSSPGQQEVLKLLTQLYDANILYYDVTPNSGRLFERYNQRRKKEIQSKLLSIMFIRIPLLDPDAWLNKVTPLINLVCSRVGALVWLLVLLFAGKTVVDNFDQAMAQVEGVLAPNNLFMLYAGLVFVKALHEFGHAAICKRFGGEVHTMGVMLMVFSPLPYMDATASWSFREPWKRAVVGSAGMIVELFVAAIAVFVWAATGQGVVHSLAYNIMFVASVSTVLFNINPLLRFDGYYILSDLLDIPNLSGRASMHLRHIAEKYLFGCKDSQSPARTTNEGSWLVVFGILSGIYRVVVFVGIILFVADKFLLAGLFMALLCVFSWGIVPLYRFVLYLAASPHLARTRPRAVTVTVSLVFVTALLLAVIPLPNRFRAPGVIEAKEYVKVVSSVAGYVAEIMTPSGVFVEPGTPLIRLTNHELDLEYDRVTAQYMETLAMRQHAMSNDVADVEPVEKRLDTLKEAIANIEQQKKGLLITARKRGLWVAPYVQDMNGTWLARGGGVGEIVNPASFRFSAIVSQDEASNLFIDQIRKIEVMLLGQAGKNITVVDYQIIPFQHEYLPSAALGWMGGGDVAVSLSDDAGLKTEEPFFQIYADVTKNDNVLFLHGRSGKIRLTMAPEPLLWQWGRAVRQLLQKRYQI